MISATAPTDDRLATARSAAARPAPSRHRLLALAGTAGLLLGTAACGSDGGGTGAAGAGRLSYDQARSTAQDLSESGPCPFGLDLAAALKGAGVDLPVTAGAKGHLTAETEVEAEVPAQPWPSGATPPAGIPSIPATPARAWVTCHFTAGATPVRVDLLALAEHGPAISLMLPHIQRFGNLGVDQLQDFADRQPATGQTKVTPGGGLVGVSRPAVRGKGDLALTLTQTTGEAPTEPALTGEPLRRATERLAAQLRP
ncbi:hypothetical protein ACFVYP_27050 [Kitasatospora sp. NPDC058201]|uniref:hypothetical protein n=1 Tax=unclassified Kitasatospora TaxID=2633591 RepID=UPI003658B8BA